MYLTNFIRELRKKKIMTDKQIINKVREWLILNIRSMTLEEELIEDNKLLLKAIRDWKQESEDK
tara:strand:- start:333 stop:524 length:192 start_codon:yes stop_codon:yes gene_type:complete